MSDHHSACAFDIDLIARQWTGSMRISGGRLWAWELSLQNNICGRNRGETTSRLTDCGRSSVASGWSFRLLAHFSQGIGAVFSRPWKQRLKNESLSCCVKLKDQSHCLFSKKLLYPWFYGEFLNIFLFYEKNSSSER